jgi:hypothetical protein
MRLIRQAVEDRMPESRLTVIADRKDHELMEWSIVVGEAEMLVAS